MPVGVPNEDLPIKFEGVFDVIFVADKSDDGIAVDFKTSQGRPSHSGFLRQECSDPIFIPQLPIDPNLNKSPFLIVWVNQPLGWEI